jgi:adenylate cyclase
MFTDMVGYTAASQADEKATLALRKEQEAILRPLLTEHQGRKVKSTGDGLLVEFESALKATECAVNIQRRLHERNAKNGITPINLRIGIHLGDVEQQGTDIFGDAVNIASRIEPLASPGGVCISGEVFSQVRNKIPNKLEKIPPTALKGLQIPLDIYRVVLPWTLREPPTPTPGLPRLAVLPFANISPDSNDEYFADGLTEELISVLSQIRGLRVISHTSVNQYRGTSKQIAQIGSELGVDSVLEGSVRKAGDQLRISVQLIDARTDEHRWSETYDRRLENVFAIQAEVAEKTADALRLELVSRERESIRREPTTNLVAYSIYLRGIHEARSTFEGEVASIPLFEEAIRRDPDFSEPYAALANSLIALVGDVLPYDEVHPRARELITKALELDPKSSDAHTARGNLALQFDHEWSVAEDEFKRAIALNPSNAHAHFWNAWLLRIIGRYEASVREFRTALELDPLWTVSLTGLWLVQSLAGDFASAIASAKERLERTPDDSTIHVALGLVYAEAGRTADARAEAEHSSGPLKKWAEWSRGILCAHVGQRDEARRVLTAMEETSRSSYVSPCWIAELCAALGEKESAIDWLERDNGEGAKSLWFRYQERAFDSIREDPRFKAMLKASNLPTDGKWARNAGTGNRSIPG